MTSSRRNVFVYSESSAVPATEVSLSAVGMKERQDLQEWVIAHPEVLGDDVLVVTAEFDQWQSESGAVAHERLDILALDTSGRPVVVELKRDTDKLIHIQALTYAAMVAAFDEETLAQAHSAFLTKRGSAIVPASEALERLRSHVDGDLSAGLKAGPRIILLAGRHLPQTVTTTVWLTQRGLDIELREVRAYQHGSQLVVAFEQLYPVAGVDSLLLSPARRATADALQQVEEQARSASAVRIIVDGDLLETGTLLTLQPTVEVTAEVRAAVDAWVDADPSRGEATWVNDASQPLLWKSDGQRWRPTSLVRHILREAAGVERGVRGTAWWVDADGLDLAAIAGISGNGASRDWSDLHAVIASIQPGEWTSYGDVGQAIGMHPRPIGTHISRCDACPVGAHRVMTDAGRPAENFHWASGETRSCREVLEGEGLAFDSFGKAHASARVRADELMRRVSGN